MNQGSEVLRLTHIMYDKNKLKKQTNRVFNIKMLTDNVDREFQRCCCDDGGAHRGSSAHVGPHRIHRGRGLQRNAPTTDRES